LLDLEEDKLLSASNVAITPRVVADVVADDEGDEAK